MPEFKMMIDPEELVLAEEYFGQTMNPRGKVIETADLQVALAGGQKEPITVFQLPDGRYAVRQGNRRTIALRKMKQLAWVAVDDTADIDPIKVLADMLETNIRKPIPIIRLDSNDQIVAGLCYTVKQLADAGKMYMEISELMPTFSDDAVSAMHQLFDASPMAVKAVATGTMAITTFALIKHYSPEEQEAIMKQAGSYTQTAIKNSIKRFKEGGGLDGYLERHEEGDPEADVIYEEPEDDGNDADFDDLGSLLLDLEEQVKHIRRVSVRSRPTGMDAARVQRIMGQLMQIVQGR